MAASKTRLKRLLALWQYSARSKTIEEFTGSSTTAFPAKPEEEAPVLHAITLGMK